MNGLLVAAIALAAIALLFFAAARANEVFRIEVEGGRARLVRGRPPPGFLDDVGQLAKHVTRGTLRAVKRDGRPHLVTAGLDEPTAQRLRNTFATYNMTLHRARRGSRL